MFRRDSDCREMRRAVLVDEHKYETGHLARCSYDPIAQIAWFGEQVIECVLRIILTVAKTAHIKPENLAQIFFGKWMDRVLGVRSGDYDLGLRRFEMYEKVSDRLKDRHGSYSINMQSP